MGVGTAGTLSGTGTVNGNATLTGGGIINFGSGGTIAGTLGVTGGNWNGLGIVNGLVTVSTGFTVGSGAILTANGGLTFNILLVIINCETVTRWKRQIMTWGSIEAGRAHTASRSPAAKTLRTTAECYPWRCVVSRTRVSDENLTREHRASDCVPHAARRPHLRRFRRQRHYSNRHTPLLATDG